jgi:hypothetical protein
VISRVVHHCGFLTFQKRADRDFVFILIGAEFEDDNIVAGFIVTSGATCR